MRFMRCRLIITVAALACADLGNICFAQMGRTAYSLEWLVADSDVIVRASVAEVERVPIPNPEPKIPQNPRVEKRVTLTVDETLVGEHTHFLVFTDQTLAYDHILEGWKDAGTELLWFLKRVEERGADPDEESPRLKPYGGGWSVIRLGPSVPEERGFSSVPPPIFTMNLSVLEESADIMDAARAIAKDAAEHGHTESYNLTLPHSVMRRSGKSGDINLLRLPVDHRLERLASRLIESPEDFLAEDELVNARWLRHEGIKALTHLKEREKP